MHYTCRRLAGKPWILWIRAWILIRLAGGAGSVVATVGNSVDDMCVVILLLLKNKRVLRINSFYLQAISPFGACVP